MYTGGTKEGELRRTREVCIEILEREGVNQRGIYFVVAFLKDSQTDLGELLERIDWKLTKV